MTVSCAIIAWNEAKTIDLTLKSIEGFADEVIIIDTGSFDGTQKVAEEQLEKLRLEGRVEQREVKHLQEARFASLDACICDWILLLDANQVLSDNLQRTFSNHMKKHKGKVCAFRSLNLMGDYEHYFKNLPYMNWHSALFERKIDLITPHSTLDRPRFKSKIIPTRYWAVNLSRVRPAWRCWYRGEPFDYRYFKKGDKTYSIKTSYMDCWSREKKYTSIIDFIEAKEKLSLNDVKKIAPAWYLQQLQHNATYLKHGMREQMPEVIKREMENPRYTLVYENNKIVGRDPTL